VREPDPAAPHAGAGAEDPALRAAAQGLPEEASGRRDRPEGHRKYVGETKANAPYFFINWFFLRMYGVDRINILVTFIFN